MGQVSGLAGELNFIVSYWWNGCRTPFNLMVECAREPAGIVALALLDTGIDDLVRSFTRPKGLGGHKSGRKKRGSKKLQFNGIPEISDLIAGRVDGVDDWRKRDVQNGVRSLWKLDNLIQGVTWNVVVVELSTDFAFMSVLGMLKLKATKCDVPGRGMIQGEDLSPFNNGQWYVLPMQEQVYLEYPVHAGPYTLFGEGSNYYQIIASTLAYKPGGIDGWLEWEFRVSAAEGGGIFRSARHTIGPGSAVSDFFAIILKAPFQLSLYQRSEGDIIYPEHYMTAFPSMFTNL